MTRLFANANYDFIGFRKIAYIVTAIVIIPGLLINLIRGLNYSIEFTGGTLVQVHTTAPQATIGTLREALDRGGIHQAEISEFGSKKDFVVRTRLAGQGEVNERTAEETRDRVQAALTQAWGANGFVVGRGQVVGPKVGGELRQKALIAILLSFVATLVYLAFRFEWRFGVAAVIATAHDILTTMAFIGYMKLEVSLVVVSAILTVVGYSLNDTIIIFDRTRENLHKYRRDDLGGILNRSINETLPRSIMTHVTTLAATLALLFFAGEVTRPFAIVMAFGIFVATFSSIYVASPILMYIENRWPRKADDRSKVATRALRSDLPPSEPSRRVSRKEGLTTR